VHTTNQPSCSIFQGAIRNKNDGSLFPVDASTDAIVAEALIDSLSGSDATNLTGRTALVAKIMAENGWRFADAAIDGETPALLVLKRLISPEIANSLADNELTQQSQQKQQHQHASV
jgi:hypothetical protein